MPKLRYRSFLAVFLPTIAAALGDSTTVRAQTDSVTIIAQPDYAADGLKRWLLGSDYRDLWTTPIRVPVLDLDTFAGGLEPVERGGGMQTISLRFLGADGREYNFRSVDKDQGGGLHPDFQNTLIDRIAQDQVSSKHPASALIADPLLEAAGVLHARPQLFVMPDDPALGEYRELFAGMLGLIEVHTNEGEGDTPGFAGAVTVAGADRLLEHIEEDPSHQVHNREYLRARLMDFFLGDWDRHLGQWRWARYERDSVHLWIPVPEDRDNAFSSFDGLLLDIIRGRAPRLVTFEEEYPSLFGLTNNAQQLDRRLLSELPREAYVEIAADLQSRLTDEVIASAIANSPPEYQALRGEEIARKLRTRRAELPEIAMRFYDQLAAQVEVHATDESDLALVDRMEDGSVEVRLFADVDDPADPYFYRRFYPEETQEVRIDLHGDDDRAVVRGDVRKSLMVRIIGGGSDDILVDSSSVRGRSRTAFYDAEGDNEFVTTAATIVDEREFEEPEGGISGFNENAPGFRDWGKEISWFEPWAEWRYNVGPAIGGGPRVTKYGFRQVPYSYTMGARALYAPLENRFGLELDGDFRKVGSLSHTTVDAYVTQLAVTRFHGFGNETANTEDAELYKVWETQIGIEPLYHQSLGPRAELFAGPVLRYTNPELEDEGPATLLDPLGTDPFLQLGAQVGFGADTRDLPSYPRHGVFARVEGSAFTATGDIQSEFGALDAFAAAYFPVPFPLESTLAIRGGGSQALGDFPFQEAAFVGGSGSLRGFARQRFAGEAAAFAGAELRTYLTRFKFISRGDLGIIAFGDAGRVFVEDETSEEWHTGYGGGLWVGILDRTRTFSAVVGHGETTVLYLAMGMPF
ncbi:MAG TPA: BamA/TamA family outer membrane protein [Longimicrobiaceae bacterium]|nr:BamA/TamA family outer membrane protein [Longimicrobiaceae bacterium]